MKGHPELRQKLGHIARHIPKWHGALDYKDRAIWIAAASKAHKLLLHKARKHWLIEAHCVISDYDKLQRKYAPAPERNGAAVAVVDGDAAL